MKTAFSGLAFKAILLRVQMLDLELVARLEIWSVPVTEERLSLVKVILETFICFS